MNPVLVVNSGSSSLKFGLFVQKDADEEILLEGTVNGIGTPGGTLVLKDSAGKEVHTEPAVAKGQSEALTLGLKLLAKQDLPAPVAIGHRVVHGGPKLLDHTKITPEVIQTLKDSTHFAPLHIPASLKLIDAAGKAYPGLPQFACFDTTFHRTMPEEATHLALPLELWAHGVRRYGFHGLSYESIVHKLGDAVPKRLIVAHLGNGCSVCAMTEGKSVDTSMGFTPTGGVVMATRTGDIDPGVLLYLMRTEKLEAEALEVLLNKQSGLLALSGAGSDVRDIEKVADGGDARAAMALEVFYRTIAKTIAGYVSVLGGLDGLVFTGGIGEHSERTRRAICERLGFLNVGDIRALPAEEELQIARHCRRLLA
ncbi:acetate kinase [Granulicella rosea]|uniref:Acetate kinase n=1 Tax=Granulicella rosea TaxID=474952 RepID=A0A239LHQ7_9BACT|nr:acetate/propionate family kinase [Granulicella rosea]SNT30011.1 acetate kinase [Granulicella rosea]